MKKTTKPLTKLPVQLETVRVLGKTELDQAQGGVGDILLRSMGCGFEVK